MSKILTHHGKQRMIERGHITHDKDAKRNAQRAYQNGIRHADATGDLKKWFDRIYFKYESANQVRIYRDYVYIFHNDVLITFFALPEAVSDMLINGVSEKVFKKYHDDLSMRRISKKDKRNTRAKERAKEIRNDFWNRVIIEDLKDAFPDLPVEIKRLRTEPKKVSIFFVSKIKGFIDLGYVTDYLRTCYGFRSVYVKRLKEEKLRKKEEAEIVYRDEDDEVGTGIFGSMKQLFEISAATFSDDDKG